MESDDRLIPIGVMVEGSLMPAFLSYLDGSPRIMLEPDSSSVLAQEFEVYMEIQIDKNSNSVRLRIDEPLWVSLKPILKVERKIVLDGNKPDQIYPPSSNGWYSRLDDFGRDAIIFVHGIRDDPRFWLSIVDKRNSEIYEAHQILPYELGILEITDEFRKYFEVFRSLRNPNDARNWLTEILDGAPPSWDGLAELVSGVHIPNLRLGRNMRETMDQLVPMEYDDDAREQIMGFLALVVDWTYPEEDPVAYFDRIYPLEILSSLLMRHLMATLRNQSTPSYVRIFQNSARRLLAVPVATLRDERSRNIWYIAQQRILEQMTYGGETSLHYSEKLNEANRLFTKLPVSRKQAITSRKSWIDRFLLMANGLRLVTLAKPFAIGLTKLISITRAHQWPHKHMRWSAKLGGGSYKEPEIQVMELPPTAAKRVLDARPTTVEIEWSKTKINARLYDSSKNLWRISASRLLGSIRGEKSIRKLQNEYGSWQTEKTHVPTRMWARCLDVTANLGFLSDLEQHSYLKLLKLTPKSLLSTLTELKKKSIIDIQYTPAFVDLVSTAIIAQGPTRRICSLARGVLKHSSSATVSLGQKGSWLLALIRLPQATARQITSQLPEMAAGEDVALNCYRALSYRSYQWDFYQRILKKDRTWDNDVSAMLSQIRLPHLDEEG